MTRLSDHQLGIWHEHEGTWHQMARASEDVWQKCHLWPMVRQNCYLSHFLRILCCQISINSLNAPKIVVQDFCSSIGVSLEPGATSRGTIGLIAISACIRISQHGLIINTRTSKPYTIYIYTYAYCGGWELVLLYGYFVFYSHNSISKQQHTTSFWNKHVESNQPSHDERILFHCSSILCGLLHQYIREIDLSSNLLLDKPLDKTSPP